VQEPEHRRVRAGGRLVEEVLEVVAGSEAVGLAVDEDHAHLRVGLGRLDRIGHRLVHVGGDRVFLVGAIELDAGDAVFGRGEDVGH